MKRTIAMLMLICGMIFSTVAQNFSIPVAIPKQVDRQRQYGFVKHDGTVVADFTYYRAREFSEGLAAVRDFDGIWGFIDTTGERVILMPEGVSEVGTFSEGLCWFRDRELDKVGYIDRQGTVVFEPQWGFAQDFSDGLAAVGDAETFGNMRNIKELTGYIDHSGKLVISIGKTHINSGSEGFNNHRAVIRTFDEVMIIDPTGKTVVKREDIKSANVFSEGLCAVKVETNWPCGGKENQKDCVSKWGFVDTAGRMAIKAEFDDAKNFAEGLCVVKTEDGKFAFIDHTGKNVMDRLFTKAWSFSEGLAYVEELDGTKVFIDHTGKRVVPIPDDYTPKGSSLGGLIEIFMSKTEDGYSLNSRKLINHKGEEVWKNEWLVYVGYEE